MAPLVALIVFLGVYPKPVLDRITPSVTRLVHHVDASTGTHQPAVANGPDAAGHAPCTRRHRPTASAAGDRP